MRFQNNLKKCSLSMKLHGEYHYKPLTEFGRDMSSPDGRGYHCNDCVKIRRKELYEKKKSEGVKKTRLQREKEIYDTEWFGNGVVW